MSAGRSFLDRHSVVVYLSLFDHFWSFTCEWKRIQLITSAFAMAIFLGWSWFSFWTVKLFIKSSLSEALNLHFSATWFTNSLIVKQCQKPPLSLYYVAGLSWQNNRFRGQNVKKKKKKKKKIALNLCIRGQLPRSFCSCASRSKINNILNMKLQTERRNWYSHQNKTITWSYIFVQSTILITIYGVHVTYTNPGGYILSASLITMSR